MCRENHGLMKFGPRSPFTTDAVSISCSTATSVSNFAGGNFRDLRMWLKTFITGRLILMYEQLRLKCTKDYENVRNAAGMNDASHLA
jgi:hypothetical protein